MTTDSWSRASSARPGPRSSTAGTFDQATQERLLDATDRLVRQVGLAKTSMSDVARAAGVARGTLYRYFESREVLFERLSQRTIEQFFAEVAVAMDRQPTLSGQLGEFSRMMIRSIHPDVEVPPNNQAVMIRLLATENAQALRRTAGFLRPYVDAAHARGEVRANLDIDDASEWLVRVLLSFAIFQTALSYEADDPHSVRSFVQRYVITGLAGK
jgi:AcrR family transcriptional regulator